MLAAAWAVAKWPFLLVKVYPFSSALYLSNLYPVGVLLLGGGALLLSRRRSETIRLAVWIVILFGVSLVPTWRLWGEPAWVGEPQFFADGTCRQSSVDTCSAAGMVTLLGQNGIEVTEAMMARLGRTKAGRGTHPLGIYRALSWAVGESTGSLEVRYERVPVEYLLEHGYAAIITVGLREEPTTELEREMVAKYQWTPRVMHSVVLLGKDEEQEGFARIADPDFGIEKWPVRSVEVLYQGAAIWLE